MSKYQKLFNYLNQEFDILPLESDMREIKLICEELEEEDIAPKGFIKVTQNDASDKPSNIYLNINSISGISRNMIYFVNGDDYRIVVNETEEEVIQKIKQAQI